MGGGEEGFSRGTKEWPVSSIVSIVVGEGLISYAERKTGMFTDFGVIGEAGY